MSFAAPRGSTPTRSRGSASTARRTMSPYRRAGTAEDVLSRSMMRNQAADRRPMGKHQCDLAGQLTLWCSPAPAPSGGASALKPRTPRTDHAFLSGATALATPPTEDATCVLISAHPCASTQSPVLFIGRTSTTTGWPRPPSHTRSTGCAEKSSVPFIYYMYHRLDVNIE